MPPCRPRNRGSSARWAFLGRPGAVLCFGQGPSGQALLLLWTSLRLPLLAADLCDDVAQYLDQLLHQSAPKDSLPPPAQKGGLNRFRAAVHSTQDLLSLMSKAKELQVESEHPPLIIAMRSAHWGRVPRPKDPPLLLSLAGQSLCPAKSQPCHALKGRALLLSLLQTSACTSLPSFFRTISPLFTCWVLPHTRRPR